MLFQRCPLGHVEAVRAGRSVPQDAEKVAESEPWARHAVDARR
jgi:hypothetical protein